MSWRVQERIVLVLVLVLLVTAPLLLGSVPGFDTAEADPGPLLAFFQALGPWYLFLLLGVVLAAARPGLERGSRHLFFLLLALAGLSLLQMLPLPSFLAGILAPTATAHREALGVEGWTRISWEPDWTNRDLWRFLAYAGVLSATLVGIRSRRGRWIVAGALVVGGAAEAGYGILEKHVLGNRILGFGKLTGTDEITGTFINRNHLAGLLEIALPTALALLVYRRRVPLPDDRRRPFGILDGLLVVASLLMGLGVILTVSRGAYAALFGGLLVFLLLAYGFRRERASRATLAVFVVLLVAVPLLIVQLYEPLTKRFSYGVSDKGFFDVRFPAWESTLDLVAEQPVLGTGLGSYRHAIHAYQSPQVAGELYYAHNDYLNLLADGGVVGLLLGVLFALACLRLALRHARGPEGQSRSLGMAAVAAMAGVGLHCLFEFNLQIPGVAVPLLLLVGLGAVRSREGERQAPTGGWPRFAARVGVMAVVGGSLFATWALDDLARSRGRGMLRAGRPGEALELFERAFDQQGRGEALFALAEAEPEGGVARHYGARLALMEATSDHPLRAEPWYRLGLVHLAEKNVEDAFESFKKARRFSRGLGEMNYRMGVTLVLLGATRENEAMLDEGLAALREAGAIEPRLFSRGFDVVRRFIRDIDVLKRMTPDTPYGKAAIVGLLIDAGRLDDAADEQAALERLDPTPPAALGLAEILVRAGRYEEAEAPMRRYLERAGIVEKTLDDVYRLYMVGRRRGPARDFFRSLVKGPGRGVGHAHFLLARILSDLGKHDEALEEIRAAIRYGGNDPAYLRKEKAIQADRAAER